ncbi:MAG: hypothetical protein WC460_06085 [Patescibacteria group bacterium]
MTVSIEEAVKIEEVIASLLEKIVAERYATNSIGGIIKIQRRPSEYIAIEFNDKKLLSFRRPDGIPIESIVKYIFYRLKQLLIPLPPTDPHNYSQLDLSMKNPNKGGEIKYTLAPTFQQQFAN